MIFWEVVVAQLVERSLSIPEVRGSNPVIGKIYWTFVYCQLYWKDENKEKEAGNGPFKKNYGELFQRKVLSADKCYSTTQSSQKQAASTHQSAAYQNQQILGNLKSHLQAYSVWLFSQFM